MCTRDSDMTLFDIVYVGQNMGTEERKREREEDEGEREREERGGGGREERERRERGRRERVDIKPRLHHSLLPEHRLQ